jgi:hypothetical protein
MIIVTKSDCLVVVLDGFVKVAIHLFLVAVGLKRVSLSVVTLSSSGS